jgi:hypothetical protein
MEYGGFGQLIDPEASAVETTMRGGVSGQIVCEDVARGEFAGGERVVDAFAGERLDHAGGVADEEKIAVRGRQGCAGEGSDRAPRVV